MTKEETVRELLTELIDMIDNGSQRDLDRADEICVSIIKLFKQEPKTVLYSGDGYADGYMVYDMAECPNCGYEYEEGDKDWGLPFCPNCGQSLNWESEDEE